MDSCIFSDSLDNETSPKLQNHQVQHLLFKARGQGGCVKIKPTTNPMNMVYFLYVYFTPF